MKECIRDARVKLGITQAELASRLNVTQAAVSHWEQGISMPTPKQIPVIAKILKVTVSELFEKAV